MIGIRHGKTIAVVIGLAAFTSFGVNSAMSDPPPAPSGGPYSSSAHGSSVNGVDRSTIDASYSVFAKGNCSHCHEQHASLEGAEPAPISLNNLPSPALGFAAEQDLCFECHDASGPAPAAADVETQFNSLTYKHGKAGAFDYMETYDNRHQPKEQTSVDFSALDRHAECADCHNPHKATKANPLLGASGITVTNGAGWAEPSYSATTAEVSSERDQYKVCFKCHSGWAGYGAGTNQGVEFNPGNRGFHGAGASGARSYPMTMGTFNMTYVYKMMPRYKNDPNYDSDAELRDAPMICSDCHGYNDGDPQGVHGSNLAKILKVPVGSNYTAWNNTITYASNSTTIWCFNCHSSTFAGTGFAVSGGTNLHTNKHDGDLCMDCHVKVPHGWNERPRLVKPYNLAGGYARYQGTSASTGIATTVANWRASGNWTESSAGSPHQNCTNN
ncbi:MAG: hypothetical protein C4519_05035 [Desulfobacteraceae bacterium]|nr:MAG: hypothetical protein C4519_05035 [Desulfobacteraceae bacterium]